MPIKRVETGSQIPLSAVLKEEVDHAAIAVAADDNEVSVVFHAICASCEDKKLLDSVSGNIIDAFQEVSGPPRRRGGPNNHSLRLRKLDENALEIKAARA